MNAPLTLPQRAGIAAVVAALGAGAVGFAQAPEPGVWLICPAVPAHHYLDAATLFSKPSFKVPSGAVSAASRGVTQGKVFAPAGCVDGWLTTAAIVDPDALAAPAPGFVSRAARLTDARPQSRVDIFLQGELVIPNVRVLRAAGEAVPDRADGKPIDWSATVAVELEVPESEAARVDACLGAPGVSLTARTPSQETSPLADCASVGKMREGWVSYRLPAEGLQPEQKLVLQADGVALAPGRVLSVGTDATALLEIPAARKSVLDNCARTGRRIDAVAFDTRLSPPSFADCPALIVARTGPGGWGRPFGGTPAGAVAQENP